MADRHQFSAEAFKRLKNEFDDLTNRGRIEIAQKIETARELGDLSENGDYHAAKEEQGKMEGRINQLSALLEDAEIVEIDATAQVVQPGCIIGIRYEGDDEVEKYLLGSIEEKRDGLDPMSPGSPIGQALMGHTIGDTVNFEAPNGELSVEVVSIEV